MKTSGGVDDRQTKTDPFLDLSVAPVPRPAPCYTFWALRDLPPPRYQAQRPPDPWSMGKSTQYQRCR